METHFDALAIEDCDPKIHSDDEIDPEATAKTADASGTNCDSNQQLPTDDESFNNFLMIH